MSPTTFPKLKRVSKSERPWQVLAGLCEKCFDMEPELRLFQIKHWLRGKRGRPAAFREAALIFGACYMHYIFGISETSNSDRRHKNPLRTRDARVAFGLCFRHGNLAELRSTFGVKQHARERAARWKTEGYWIELARARLQLTIEKSDKRKESAVQLVADQKIKGIAGATTAEKDKSAEPKSSYLLAADLSLKSLLEYKYNGSSLIHDLQKELPNPEAFRHFCSLIRAIDQQLMIGGDDFIASAVGVDPCGLPQLPQVPSDFVTTIGRRAAFETKRKNRLQSQR